MGCGTDDEKDVESIRKTGTQAKNDWARIPTIARVRGGCKVRILPLQADAEAGADNLLQPPTPFELTVKVLLLVPSGGVEECGCAENAAGDGVQFRVGRGAG